MNFKEIDEARKTLQLGESATLREIKTAYRELALKYHPDRCKNGDIKESEEMFGKITSAYNTIMTYCAGYRYSFRKKDVEDTADREMDEEILKNFYDGWLGDLDL
ncbi:MAG: J domain-containing protein [Candidatus Omnitrophica bacterium]|nr:J domain-containing protein [Candidatus Omnitrophota bacterium]